MKLKFDVRKYKNDGITAGTNLAGERFDLVDGTDSLANKSHQVISFLNVRDDDPATKDVYFKAFITAYNETFTPNFNATEVFGRVDPIQQYKGTTRNITLAWKMPAASESEAYENLGRVQKLLLMLYPTYLDLNEGKNPNALTLSEAPLVRLKVMNLLTAMPGENFTTDVSNTGTTDFQSTYFRAYKSTHGSENGILGVITSCTVNHNLEGVDGVFTKRVEDSELGPTVHPNTILPKLIDINISFTPLHEFTPYYKNSKDEGGTPIYPYGVKLGDISGITRREVEQGKTLAQLREIKKTLEEKRRTAASAQQKADKALAAYKKANKKISRKEKRGKIDSLEADAQRFEALEGIGDTINTASDANEELQNIEDLLG